MDSLRFNLSQAETARLQRLMQAVINEQVQRIAASATETAESRRQQVLIHAQENMEHAVGAMNFLLTAKASTGDSDAGRCDQETVERAQQLIDGMLRQLKLSFLVKRVDATVDNPAGIADIAVVGASVGHHVRALVRCQQDLGNNELHDRQLESEALAALALAEIKRLPQETSQPFPMSVLTDLGQNWTFFNLKGDSSGDAPTYDRFHATSQDQAGKLFQRLLVDSPDE